MTRARALNCRIATVVVCAVSLSLTQCSSAKHAEEARKQVKGGMTVAQVMETADGWMVCGFFPRPSDSTHFAFDVMINGRGNYYIENGGRGTDREVTSKQELGQILQKSLGGGHTWEMSFQFDGTPASRFSVFVNAEGRVEEVSGVVASN